MKQTRYEVELDYPLTTVSVKVHAIDEGAAIDEALYVAESSWGVAICDYQDVRVEEIK